jgi:hypothetical protein
MVILSSLKTGKNPLGITSSKPAIIGKVKNKPIAPPSMDTKSDSPKINPIICLAEKPKVFITAYSLVLSLADIIIVLPNTSIIIPTITNDIKSIAVIIAPLDAINP